MPMKVPLLPIDPYSPAYCHNICPQNYFNSPKMPVKDHMLAFKSTSTCFKPHSGQENKEYQAYSNTIKNMKLNNDKPLCIVTYSSQPKDINSFSHSKQTNPGFSRNALGGLYTK